MVDVLASWRDTPAKTAIVEFVDAVTDPSSDAFVPEADRVAVFDNDGTLSTENPYAQLAFAMDRAAELGKPTTPDELKAGGIPAVLELVKLTHGSISTDRLGRWLNKVNGRFEQKLRIARTGTRHGTPLWQLLS